jgi:hypothetical protein
MVYLSPARYPHSYAYRLSSTLLSRSQKNMHSAILLMMSQRKSAPVLAALCPHGGRRSGEILDGTGKRSGTAAGHTHAAPVSLRSICYDLCLLPFLSCIRATWLPIEITPDLKAL